MQYSTIIVAGGSGSRMNSSIKKQYMLLDNKPILAHTIEVFEKIEEISEIILVVSEGDEAYVENEICKAYGYTKITKIIAGGKERQDSVWNGLQGVSQDTKYVLIHDAARPFVSEAVIKTCMEDVKKYGASIAAVPVKDTIKVVKNGIVDQTPLRDTLWAVQTPQIFERELLITAHKEGKKQNLCVTDDSMLLEKLGQKVCITLGEYTNIKITTPEDLKIGETIIEKFK